MTKKLILIAGPTASGKSKLSLEIAKILNGEIINADSMQVYKNFSTLSSRPKKKDLKKIKHHLYGFISARNYFSTGEWLRLVKKKINTCIKKNKIPILVGGTGLYFNAITKGISEIPEIELKKRNFIRKLHSRLGQEKFYNLLIKLDPLAKEKIISTDTQRTIRAYEVKLITKKSIFQWARNTKSEFLSYDIKKIFLDIPRDNLLKNIEKRTNEMITTGCVKEVKSFLKLNIDKNLSANKLIGVKELESYIRGNISLNQAKDLIIIKTRQYAKSQKTWSRGHMKNWKKLYSKDFSALLKKALKVLS